MSLTHKILTIEEIKLTVKKLRKNFDVKPNRSLSLAIFRLSCCCGLRSIEMRGLLMCDIVLGVKRPYIRIRKENTKGKKRIRAVPLWWDKGTYKDICLWYNYRKADGASPSDLFLVTTRKTNAGRQFTRGAIGSRWTKCLRWLEPERRKTVTIHCGRHTFCSHALRAGRTLVEVRDAAGHANISTTSLYLHTIERDDVQDIFDVS